MNNIYTRTENAKQYLARVRETRRNNKRRLIRKGAILAILALIAYYVVPPLFIWQGAQIDLGLQTQDRIYAGQRAAKEANSQ